MGHYVAVSAPVSAIVSAMFEAKVVVVTGASSGIGRALCLELAPQRPRLVLAARDAARLEAAAALCRASGAETLVVPTDVASPDDCARLVARTVHAFGGIDVLVHNAGASMYATFEEVSDLGIYERLMQVNYLGGVHLTAHALPHLKKSRGRIVVIASLAGLTGVPTRTGYAASKHAVFGFFDSLRIELAATGVTVTIVAPDFVVSEIHERAVDAAGKPVGHATIQQSKALSAEACARIIIDAMAARRRLAFTSLRGRFGRILQLLSPSFVDWLAARAVRRGR